RARARSPARRPKRPIDLGFASEPERSSPMSTRSMAAQGSAGSRAAPTVSPALLLIGRLFFVAIFLRSGSRHFSHPMIGLCGGAGRAYGEYRGSPFGCDRRFGWAQYFARIPRETLRVADRALSRLRNADDAPILYGPTR